MDGAGSQPEPPRPLRPDYWPLPDVNYMVEIADGSGATTALTGTFKSVPPYWLELPLPSPSLVTRITLRGASNVTWIALREMLYEDCR